MFYKALLLSLLLCFSSHARSELRLITLAPHLTEWVYALGLGDQIVATVDHSDYPAQAKDIARIGNAFHLNLEAIVALKPDWVLIWPMGNQTQLKAQLAPHGIQVFESHNKDLFSLPDNLQALSRALGQETQSHSLIENLRLRLKQLQAQQNEREPKRVFYQLGSSPLMSVAKGSFIDQAISLCGGDNIMKNAPSSYPLVSLEEVIFRNPQIIVLSNDDNPWLRWSNIEAVAKEQIIRIDPDRLHRLTPRTLDGIEDLCAQMAKLR